MGVTHSFPLKIPMLLSCDSRASKHLSWITDLSLLCLLNVLFPSQFVFPDWAQVVLAQTLSILGSNPVRGTITPSCALLCAIEQLPLGLPIWSPSYIFTVSSPLGSNPCGQDQKCSDSEQSVGLIIFLSEPSCVPDMLSLEKACPGRGDYLPGMPGTCESRGNIV